MWITNGRSRHGRHQGQRLRRHLRRTLPPARDDGGAETYAFTTIALDASGGPHADHDVALLPDVGSVVLLALVARGLDGAAADVTAELDNGANHTTVHVHGALLVANPDALAAIVAGGPRSIGLTNEGPAPITVDVLAGRVAT
jgi:hypothetical protein